MWRIYKYNARNRHRVTHVTVVTANRPMLTPCRVTRSPTLRKIQCPPCDMHMENVHLIDPTDTHGLESIPGRIQTYLGFILGCETTRYASDVLLQRENWNEISLQQLLSPRGRRYKNLVTVCTFDQNIRGTWHGLTTTNRSRNTSRSNHKRCTVHNHR